MEVSTPGRICLFGEHQDYLGLPVIAMAISLRVNIVGEKRKDRKIIIHKPDLGKKEIFSLDNLDYNKPTLELPLDKMTLIMEKMLEKITGEEKFKNNFRFYKF